MNLAEFAVATDLNFRTRVGMYVPGHSILEQL